MNKYPIFDDKPRAYPPKKKKIEITRLCCMVFRLLYFQSQIKETTNACYLVANCYMMIDSFQLEIKALFLVPILSVPIFILIPKHI